ncbi:MAG: GNAT family N-acetyltransferase [Alphaproteobacteria bacterium]|nr:GNAT family N-acetyltransferase [Alphaproteobacteria bacterium]
MNALIEYRQACEADTPLILSFIKKLAEYENLLHEVEATEKEIRQSLFCDDPKAFCVIAEHEGKPVGFSVCFYNYSTFQGKSGIYIEDIYVEPAFRGHGIGKGFFSYLAKKAVAEDCGRVQWWVLDWNESSIEFYKKLGAKAMDEWTVYRLEGEPIRKLAEAA